MNAVPFATHPHTASAPNPGLASFDLTGYAGVRGQNFYDEDRLLHRILRKYSQHYSDAHFRDMVEHLHRYAALVGGELNELTEAAHKEGKYGEVIKYDATGNRIDEVRYCREQTEVRRLHYEAGLVNLDFQPDWKHEYTMLHRMAAAYVANQNGEGGITCPLAMTDGMIRVLKALGTEEQKNRYLPLIAGPESKSHFMCGQYVTERVGGSNVGQNRTTARRREDGKWILQGEKWFCSNPGDLWVTTARVLGADGHPTATIGMFLVPRIKANGELNGCHILRKKDIIGSRGKITVEAVYEDLEAEELGRPAHGLANMIKYVINTSRQHVAVSACGQSRRAYIEARAYAAVREAYGQKIIEFAPVLRTLAEMQILHSSVVWTAFRNFLLKDREHRVCEILTPLLKYISTTHATWITHEAMMLHGGNGILGDFSVLPRLHNDAIINETWEGTHNIIGEHVLKAWSRPKVGASFEDLVEENCAGLDAAPAAGGLAYPREILRAERARLAQYRAAGPAWLDMNRTLVCDCLFSVFALSEWLNEAREGDATMLAFARGFAEIAERGRLGPTRPDGIFADPAILNMLVEY